MLAESREEPKNIFFCDVMLSKIYSEDFSSKKERVILIKA